MAKVIFLHLSVILFTGGVSTRENPPCQGEPPQTRQTPPLGADPTPWEQTPPRTRQTPPPGADTPPGEQTPPSPGQADPPWARQTPPPRSRLQPTVNERPVRILLECILVSFYFNFNINILIILNKCSHIIANDSSIIYFMVFGQLTYIFHLKELLTDPSAWRITAQ